jgi:hypothetical protein
MALKCQRTQMVATTASASGIAHGSIQRVDAVLSNGGGRTSARISALPKVFQPVSFCHVCECRKRIRE